MKVFFTDFVLVGQCRTPPPDIGKGPALELLAPVYNILDTIEPQHIRQSLVGPGWLPFVSYGFSLLRWREAVLYLQPSLEQIVNTAEALHRVLLRNVLTRIDEKEFYRDKENAGLALNVLYEGVWSLKLLPTANMSTIDFFLSALEDRISHLYCLLLPSNANIQRRQDRKIIASLFASFSKTSKVLPPGYQNCLPLNSDGFLPVMRKIIPYEHQVPSFPRFHKDCEPSASAFPRLSEYVPARFLAAFGRSTELFCCNREGMDDPFDLEIFERLENYLEDDQLFGEKSIKPLILALLPHALSITVKAASDALAIGKWELTQNTTIYLVIWYSITLCKDFLLNPHQRTHEETGGWLDKWPTCSTAMYNWAEDSGIFQHYKGKFVKFAMFSITEGYSPSSSTTNKTVETDQVEPRIAFIKGLAAKLKSSHSKRDKETATLELTDYEKSQRSIIHSRFIKTILSSGNVYPVLKPAQWHYESLGNTPLRIPRNQD